MKIYLFFLGLIFLIASQTPPGWGGNTRYSVKVGMVNNDPQVNWTFTYYYDWSIKSQRYEHQSGQQDQFCLLPDTSFQKGGLPCTMIFASDGWGYIQYPTKDFCCKCTNSFGAIRYDWLKNDSTYNGTTTIDGKSVTHWIKNGQYLNHYYSTVDKQLPVLFHEIKLGKPKEWIFDLNTYSTSPFDPSKLSPPPSCSTRCSGYCQRLVKQEQNLKITQE